MNYTAQEFSPDFERVLRDSTEKRRLMPLIRSSLRKGFPDFNITVEGYSGPRPHDGWWHPSSQGAWPQRKLFLYLAQPGLVEEEDFDSQSIEAVTAGKFWHNFYQILLQTCTDVLPHVELPLINEEHRLRGHCDGELANDANYQDELLEIKTINEFQFPKLTSDRMVRELKPDYYAQAQDYLAMRYGFGRGRMRFLVVFPGFPFPKNEFTVDANARFQERRWETYRNAWGQVQAFRAGGHVQLAEACCMPTQATAKNCECRIACPVGANV